VIDGRGSFGLTFAPGKGGEMEEKNYLYFLGVRALLKEDGGIPLALVCGKKEDPPKVREKGWLRAHS